jgi:hypothetical protein
MPNAKGNDNLIHGKADIKDLALLNDMKTNKVDTEQIMRCVDIQHYQIQNLVILFVECLKTLIKEHKESKVNRQTRRMLVLSNSMKVMSWINEFNPQNVNSKDLEMPRDLKVLSAYSQKMIGQYPKTYGSNVSKLKKSHRLRPGSTLEAGQDSMISITEPDQSRESATRDS